MTEALGINVRGLFTAVFVFGAALCAPACNTRRKTQKKRGTTHRTAARLALCARLAPRRIAPIATVIVEVTLANHRQSDFDRFEHAIAATPEVTACWSVGGGVDYFLKVMTRDVDSYQRLIDGMLTANIGIDRYFTYIVTRSVKDDSAVPMSLFSSP